MKFRFTKGNLIEDGICRAYIQDFLIGGREDVTIQIHDCDLEKIIKELHDFEKSIGYELTKVELGTVYHTLFPEDRWFRCPPMISLYILLLRCYNSNHKISLDKYKFSNSYLDQNEVIGSQHNWRLLIENLDYLFPNDRIFHLDNMKSGYKIWHGQGVGTFCSDKFLLKSFYFEGKPETQKYVQEVNEKWEQLKRKGLQSA